MRNIVFTSCRLRQTLAIFSSLPPRVLHERLVAPPVLRAHLSLPSSSSPGRPSFLISCLQVGPGASPGFVRTLQGEGPLDPPDLCPSSGKPMWLDARAFRSMGALGLSLLVRSRTART